MNSESIILLWPTPTLMQTIQSVRSDKDIIVKILKGTVNVISSVRRDKDIIVKILKGTVNVISSDAQFKGLHVCLNIIGEYYKGVSLFFRS